MVTWCLNIDTITHSRLLQFKKSQNYEPQCKFLHMQFSSNEKPTLCMKTFPKSQAYHDTLTNHFMYIKYFHIMTWTVCSIIITWKKYQDKSHHLQHFADCILINDSTMTMWTCSKFCEEFLPICGNWQPCTLCPSMLFLPKYIYSSKITWVIDLLVFQSPITKDTLGTEVKQFVSKKF